jgi:asparagine synthase (glutamine-hydrolysing)
MCGIAGGNHPGWHYEKAIASILHRGPDGKNVEMYQGMTFAFCRLAVQDLSVHAMQPMSSPDNLVHIIYNGEIYGYQKLKDDLKNKYQFRTSSDTEVILYAYLEYGKEFVDKIDGIFAMAIYDERVRKVYLFRDRIGVKPLYYYYKDGKFAFASELKALTEMLEDSALEIDTMALYDYLFYQYVPEPKSLYKHIRKLRPAARLIFDTQEKRIIEADRYWNLFVNASVGRKRKREDVAEELRGLIRQTVEEQLIADVPVGTFLSGGVDSSVITYVTNRLKPEVNAFTIGFQETQFDESARADAFCRQQHISLTQQILSSKDVRQIRNDLSKWYDEPFADVSAYPTYMLSRLARTNCTVVLTGDGGDELFGGYAHYKTVASFGNKPEKEKVYQQYAKPASSVEDYRIRWNIPKDYDPYWHFDQYYKEELPVFTRMRYMDLMTYLPESVLTKVDRASMAVSLEARVPFLARRIVEFAFSLSQEEYLSDNELKGCLKDAYKGRIPDEILYGIKMGFSVPDHYFWRERHECNMNAGILKVQWSHLEKTL